MKNDLILSRKQFPFYRSFMEALDECPMEFRLELYEAIVHYSFLGEEPKFNNQYCIFGWKIIKPTLDSAISHYIGGCNGGAPLGNQNNPDGRRGKELTKILPKTNQEPNKEEEEEEEDKESIILEDAKAPLRKQNSLSKMEECEKRKQTFYQTILPYVATYGKDMVADFFDYWSEKSKNGTKMRFEMQKTWELGRRLSYWNNHNNKN